MTQLTEHLRGVYRIPIKDGLGSVGAGEEPDNPDEFVRNFETSPIMHRAADVIDELLSLIDNARMAFAETHDDDESRCRAMAAALSAVDDVEGLKPR